MPKKETSKILVGGAQPVEAMRRIMVSLARWHKDELVAALARRHVGRILGLSGQDLATELAKLLSGGTRG